MVPGIGTSRVSTTGAIVSVVALFVGLVLAACNPLTPAPTPDQSGPSVVITAPVDVTTLAPCAHEYGPSPDGAVPCVWDAAEQGIQGPNGYKVRWLLYAADDLCPIATVQSSSDVACVRRSDWDGS